MLAALYNALGRDIVLMRAKSKWGSGYIKKISRDIQKSIPGVKSFSVTNLKYMRSFYELFPDAMEKSPQVGDELKSPQLGDESDVALVFRIPWGHNKLIISTTSSLQNCFQEMY